MAEAGIIGVGNLLLKDEGIGVHVVQALEKRGIEGVKLIDGGTSPDFPFLVQGLRKLLVIDAARMGGEPGRSTGLLSLSLSLSLKQCSPFTRWGLLKILSSLRLWEVRAR